MIFITLWVVIEHLYSKKYFCSKNFDHKENRFNFHLKCQKFSLPTSYYRSYQGRKSSKHPE